MMARNNTELTARITWCLRIIKPPNYRSAKGRKELKDSYYITDFMSKSYENDREGNKQKSSTIACHAFRCYLWTELDRILYEALYTNVSIFECLIKDVIAGVYFSAGQGN
jgi:hypothetical protein